ncbi:MAG: aminoglycoside phosphotransferase family protein [Myxococcota bacterium]
MSIPDRAADIDAAWLGAALAERHPGVRVGAVEIVEQTDGTNAHARLRVRYDADAGAPERLFCKLLPQAPGWREPIAASGMGPREVRFYRQLAPELGMRVPTMHAALHREEDGAFLLLLEDILEAGCTISPGPPGVAPDAAAGALEDLAELHQRFEDRARRAREASWVEPPLYDPSYGGRMLDHALTHHRERLGAPFAAVAECYLAAAPRMHALWEEGPTTVIHGDTHIGNLFDDAGRTGFLDWGILSTGPALRDVSYFLNMALSVEDRRTHERALLRHYLAVRRAAGGTPPSEDEAWALHRLHAAYCVVASCQIVMFPDNLSPARERFSEAFLARAQAAVDDLDAMAALRAAGIHTDG